MRVRMAIVALTCLAGVFPLASPAVAAPSPEPFTSFGAMVDRFYLDLTAKAPTTAQRSQAVSALSAGTQTPGGLLASLRESADHQNSVDPVTRLYRAFLLRIPDKGGLEFWIKRRRTGSWTLVRIADSFATSSEFTRRYGALSNQNFVKLIYDNVLERPYDQSGLSFWTRQLDTKRRTRGAVMANFSESNEYKRKQAAEVTVSVLNIFMLGRAPTKTVFDSGVSALEGGQSVTDYATEIFTSTAYADRIAAPLVIATPTLPTLYAGVPMQTVLTATGGFGDRNWSASGLPGWLTLDAATGTLSGTPPAAGVTAINATVTAGAAMTSTKTITLDVKAGMPAGCVTTDCAQLSTAAGTVQIPANTVSSITRNTSQTPTAVALTSAAPNIAVGNILVIAPGTHTTSGLIVKATAITGANGAARNVSVTKSTLTDAYANGIVKGTGTPQPSAPTVTTSAAGCSANASIDITPEATVGLKPNVTLLWGKNVAGFGDVFVGTGGVKLFQFDMFGDLTFRLKGSMSGSVDCTLDVPGVTIPISVGPAGFLFFKLQPNLGLKATAGIEIDTTVTVKCGVVFSYIEGNEFRSQYCTPSYTTPKVSTANTGADLTVSGGVTTSLTFNEAIGISGSLTASVHAGYKPLQNPIGVLDGKVTAKLTACLACAFGSGAPTLTITDATIWERTFATWNTPSTPPTFPLAISTTALPAALIGQTYNASLKATGGTKPYTWTATGLPNGLTLNTSTGVITGIPTTQGQATVAFKVNAASGATTTKSLPILVTVSGIDPGPGPGPDALAVGAIASRPDIIHLGGMSRVADDGSAVAFTSTDPYVSEDTNGLEDVYVWRPISGQITLASRTAAGLPLPEGAALYDLSRNGNLLAWTSTSGDVAPGAAESGTQQDDLFVTDLRTGEVATVTGATPPFTWRGIFVGGGFADGDRKLLFPTGASSLGSSVIYDIVTEASTTITPWNGWIVADISANGRYVLAKANDANAPNSDPGPSGADAYRLDLQTGTWVRVPRSASQDQQIPDWLNGQRINDLGHTVTTDRWNLGYWTGGAASTEFTNLGDQAWVPVVRQTDGLKIVYPSNDSTGSPIWKDTALTGSAGRGTIWSETVLCDSGRKYTTASLSGTSHNGRYVVFSINNPCAPSSTPDGLRLVRVE